MSQQQQHHYAVFYENYFAGISEQTEKDEVQVICPFHDDTEPSMSINLTTGLWRCFGKCDTGGDTYAFYQKMHGASFPEAKKQTDSILNRNADAVTPVSEEDIDKWCINLLRTPKMLEFVTEERNINKKTIERFKIGWDGHRITFPIKSRLGLNMNIRRYLPGAKEKRMINYKTGYGKARLYPIDILKGDSFLLVEGEWDMVLANQLGFKALTQTGGAGTWLNEWNDSFKDKIVYICYDCDKAGRDGSAKVAKHLHGVAKHVYVVDLGLPGTKDDKDISDFFVKHGYTVGDLRSIIENTKPFEPLNSTTHVGNIMEQPCVATTLFEARGSKYRGRRVGMKVLIVGKDLAPYTIPRKIKFTCKSMSSENNDCTNCAISIHGGESVLELAPDPKLLELIKCTNAQQQSTLRNWMGIPKCNNCNQVIEVPQNIEELLLAPEVAYDARASGDQYTLQKAFLVSSDTGAIRPNQSYEIEGIMSPDPWQQYVTFLLTSALPLQDSVSSFIINQDIREKLVMFRPKEGQTIKEKFDEIHGQFSSKVTHIYGRNDLLTALDLVYHSVLQFTFQDILISKGWVECLIIGDTRTGKSESTEKMVNHYRLGEMIFGENTSFAGLVGGMQQTQARWFITWGKIPINDRRMVIIDEASGLSEDDIARMSGIRSSGVAEITKIQTEKALARTRLLWISNPRSGRPLKTYNYGIEAIPELIGKAEDVSRFDFAVSAASEEIPAELINQLANHDDSSELLYDTESCRWLIMWAWSRRAEDIIIEEDATKAVLQYAIAMGKEYSTKIPLVEPANQRIKLIRMAVAAAVRMYSSDESGMHVIVTKEHVDFAYHYLQEVYSKPSLDYKSFSRQEKESERIADANYDNVMKFVTRYPAVADLFLRQSYLRVQDIEEQLNVEKETAKEYIYALVQARMIDRTPHGYRKTPAFIRLLRIWQTLTDNQRSDQDGVQV